jgi:hypothetical protein
MHFGLRNLEMLREEPGVETLQRPERQPPDSKHHGEE